MDMKEVPPPPPPSGFKRYKKKRSKKMDNKEVPPPPPPPPPPVLPHIRSRKKMDIKEVHLPLPRHYPPPPPPLPPPPPYGFRRHHNQSGNELEKRIARLGFPTLRPFQSKRYDNQTLPNPRCPLSNPTYPHTLNPKFSVNTTNGCFTCGENTSPWIDHHNVHFFCKRCHVEFHFGCHTYPSELTHPYHLQHPLIFTFHNYQTGVISDARIDESFCTTVLSGSDPKKSGSIDKCSWCGKNIQGNWFYRCSICKFCLDLSCSQTDPPLLVANPKSHHHSLVFYARPLLTPCDACGSVNVLDPSYACFQCNYMVHQSCIDLPRVIKITRHQHRLFHTPYLHSTIPPCRICYKPVDIKYGQYSCKHEDFSYVVHSKCATHENVWDGKELEEEPEKPDNIEDIVPFEKVSNDMIKHFSHEHHLLKLEKYDRVRDAEKQCQAYILPINSHDFFYNCMECDFFLHEVCAGLLRKLDHALHVHPLVLDPSPQRHYNQNGCLGCSRKSTGFRYKCSIEKCVLLDNVQIDVRCILVPNFFTHKAHEHPLFISTYEKGKSKICCEACKEICLVSYLQCSECKFAMCYQCATIPNEVYYKYDKHFLSLCYGEVVFGTYWCEVCEKEVDPRDWFYACNKCCITVHLQCVFGSSGYVKPGFTLYHYFTKMEVLSNSKSTRPFCTECGQRCPSSVYYKLGWLGTRTFCSLNCLTSKEKLMVLST